jgi:hypothetical protein
MTFGSFISPPQRSTHRTPRAPWDAAPIYLVRDTEPIEGVITPSGFAFQETRNGTRRKIFRKCDVILLRMSICAFLNVT